MIPRNASGGIQYGKVRDTPPRACPMCGDTFHPSRKQLWHADEWRYETGEDRPLVCSPRCAGRLNGHRRRALKESQRRARDNQHP